MSPRQRARKRRPPQTRVETVQAPTGGLNAVDAVAAMPSTDAIVLDNFFPQPGDVELRNGYTRWATGLPGWVESLLAYNSDLGLRLFAVSGSGIYNVTSGGAVAAPIVGGLTSPELYSYVNFSTPGGDYLYAANGADNLLLYDYVGGWRNITNSSAPLAITGVTTTLLRDPAVWKNRLWWVESGSFRAWYLPLQSVAGAAKSLDLSSQFVKGGVLRRIFSLSMSTSSSTDDYICFLSSNGELLVYQGTDPAFPGTFSLVGSYLTGATCKRRCIFTLKGDTYIICTDGLLSVRELIIGGRDDPRASIAYKVSGALKDYAAKYKNNTGWCGTVHHVGNKLIINIPTASGYGSTLQYVMNTVNNAWCTFSGWGAAVFEVWNDELYFGGNGYVAKCDTGTTDDGAAIPGTIIPAYSQFGSPAQKMFKSAKVILSTDASSGNRYAGLSTDYSLNVTWTPSAVFNSVGWMTTPGVGVAGCLAIKDTVIANYHRIQSIQYTFEVGGAL
jgi:hypothetical protein